MARPVFHLHGTVRRVDEKRKNDDNSLYGTGLAVLSEPDGDTVEVTAFARDLAPELAQNLKGEAVHLLVTPSARAGSRGGAFLDVTLVALVNVAEKAK